MTRIEGNAAAAGQPGAKPRRADKDQRRRLRLDAQSIERFPSPIARRQSTRTGDGEPDKPRTAIETAAIFDERRERLVRAENAPNCR